MSYLSLLEKDKINKEKYESEQLTLKELVLEINNQYTLHDGEFLIELKDFLSEFKAKQSIL